MLENQPDSPIPNLRRITCRMSSHNSSLFSQDGASRKARAVHSTWISQCRPVTCFPHPDLLYSHSSHLHPPPLTSLTHSPLMHTPPFPIALALPSSFPQNRPKPSHTLHSATTPHGPALFRPPSPKPCLPFLLLLLFVPILSSCLHIQHTLHISKVGTITERITWSVPNHQLHSIVSPPIHHWCAHIRDSFTSSASFVPVRVLPLKMQHPATTPSCEIHIGPYKPNKESALFLSSLGIFFEFTNTGFQYHIPNALADPEWRSALLETMLSDISLQSSHDTPYPLADTSIERLTEDLDNLLTGIRWTLHLTGKGLSNVTMIYPPLSTSKTPPAGIQLLPIPNAEHSTRQKVDDLQNPLLLWIFLER